MYIVSLVAEGTGRVADHPYGHPPSAGIAHQSMAGRLGLALDISWCMHGKTHCPMSLISPEAYSVCSSS